MSQTLPGTHEGNTNLYYYPDRHDRHDGLDPYWALAGILFGDAEGHVATTVEIDGEIWTVDLAYSDSGIAPRPQDDVEERLAEIELHIEGRDERKCHYNISPRFPEMEHYETSEAIDTAFDHVSADEGVDVQCQPANIHVDDLPHLLRESLQAAAEAAGHDLNRRYFRQPQGGRITQLERYVRIRRDESKQLTRQDGILQRLAMLLSTTKGTQGVHKWDNTDVVGKLHQLRLDEDGARELLPTHDVGRQIKSYHPKEPQAFDEDDALYHPKLGVLYKNKLTSGSAVAWEDRDDLVRQLDETIVNVLSWAGLPTDAGSPTFVPDDHFDAAARDDDLPIAPDPTPELEAEQDHLLLRALDDLTPSHKDVLKTVATDGGTHVEQVAESADVGLSTVYRCLHQIGDVLESHGGEIRFVSEKLRQEIRALVEDLDGRIESTADRIAALYNVNVREGAESAVADFLAKYGAEIEPPAQDEDAPTVRFDTLLSEFKSTTTPTVRDVVAQLRDAWIEDGQHDLVAPDRLWIDYRTETRDVHQRVAAVR